MREAMLGGSGGMPPPPKTFENKWCLVHSMLSLQTSLKKRKNDLKWDLMV